MKKLVFVILIALVLVGGIFLSKHLHKTKDGLVWRDATAAQIKAAANPHNFEGAPMCPACHKSEADLALLADPVQTCEACHAFANNNHPVNVTQPTPVTEVPMGPGNTVLCQTCHAEHDMSKFPDGLRMEFTPLCILCHNMH